MNNACAAKVLDWLWGDTAGFASVLRGAMKVVTAIAVALTLHQVLLHWYFAPNPDHWQALQKQIDDVNVLLADQKKALKGEPTIRICLFGSWPIEKHRRCEGEIEPITGLGYIVLRNGEAPTDVTPRRFFYMHESVLAASEIRIQASLQMLLRDIERQALNDASASDISLTLCVGTREMPGDDGCKVMAEIRRKLADPKMGLDALIDHVRVVALFFGPFHFITFAVFIFALMETVGLYYRWVRPVPTLYKVDDGELKPVDEAITKVSAFTKASVQSIGDKLFYQALQTAKRAGDKQRSLDSSGGRPSVANEAITEVEVMSGVESYRHHLIDDASSRQEHLETLGDTMLKLAFMGTVYGISAALFAARQLDTADPVEKLLAKAEMYSGIGVGFGTTLTGIILSIIAAQGRSIVSGAWFYQIGRAYDLLAIFGSDRLLSLARRHAPELKEEESKSPAVKNRDAQPFSSKRMAAWFFLIVTSALGLLYLARERIQ